MSQQKSNQAPPRQERRGGNNLPATRGQQQAPRGSVLSLPTEQWSRLEAIAKRAFKSRVLPSAVDSEDKAFIIALKGYALGLDPLYAMEHMAVIKGKATIDGQAMLALIYRAGEIQVSFPKTEKPAESCVVKMSRRGSELEVVWTIERAQRAGLLSNPSWKNYPDQMLRWRAISECARIVAPDVIGGLYLHEEVGAQVDEGGKVIDVTPPPASSEEARKPVASESVAQESSKRAAAAQHEAGDSSTASPQTDTPPPATESGQLIGRNHLSDSDPGEYVIAIGTKHRGKRIKDVPLSELVSFADWLVAEREKGKELGYPAEEFLEHAERFLADALVTEGDGSFEKLPFEEGVTP